MRLVEHYNQRDNSDWLLERFNNIFIDSGTITIEYKNTLQTNNVEIPEKLKKYFA